MKRLSNFKTVLLILFIFVSMQLEAIGFGYSVLDVRAIPEFAEGVFPASVRYQFNFPVPDFIDNNSTWFSVRFDNGLEYRNLEQHPDTGKFFEENKSEDWYFKDREYSVHYDEFLLLFEQGFLGKTSTGSDHLKLHLSLGGRFEMAFERLLWLYDKDHLSGVFWKEPDVERFPGSLWKGQPELAGNRDVLQTLFNIGFSVDYMEYRPTVQNGIRFSTMLRFSPDWMIASDGSSDFFKIDNILDVAYTPFSIEQQNPSLTWFSIVIGNTFNYRLILGPKVPYYASSESIYGIHMPATEHVVRNRTFISFFGPQIYATDLYPELDLFHDISVSAGKALNAEGNNKYSVWAASCGFRAQFIIYDIFSLYYEIGFTYKQPFAEPEFNGLDGKFGFTVEI